MPHGEPLSFFEAHARRALRSATERPTSGRSVEVLRAVHCCPSGRTVARPSELQASNRVLRHVRDFAGGDYLLRISFVNDGTYSPVSHRGLFDSLHHRPQSTEQTATDVIVRFYKERRARFKAQRDGVAYRPPPGKWDAVLAALTHGVIV